MSISANLHGAEFDRDPAGGRRDQVEAGQDAVDDLRPDPALGRARVPAEVRREHEPRRAEDGVVGRRRLLDQPSRAAPASRPLSSAARSASSISPPRETLTTIAPSGSSPSSRVPIIPRVSAVRGMWSVTTSDRRRRSSREPTRSTPSGVDSMYGSYVMTWATNGRRRSMTARPIRPAPTTPAVSSSIGGIAPSARQPVKSTRAWRSASMTRRWTARMSARACVATSLVQ